MTQTMVQPVGTFDQAQPVDQMQAIDLILRHYFQTTDWLRSRDRARRRSPW
jgi:hypothetical protein